MDATPATDADRADLAALGAEAAARAELLTCVLRGPEGLAGASFVEAVDVELIGGKRFWVYDAVLAAGTAPQAGDALLSATYAALDDAFDGAPEAPIGLCLLIADRAELERRPEAHWEDPPARYAGYLGDGRQVRIAYFGGAMIRAS